MFDPLALLIEFFTFTRAWDCPPHLERLQMTISFDQLTLEPCT